MGLSFGLLAVCVAVVSAVLFVAMPRIGMPGPLGLFLRFAAVSGVAAVGSSAMYFIFTAGGGILTLVWGDAAMVLAPALLLVALRVREGRRGRRTSLAGFALAAVVAMVTATVPLPDSLAVKAVALAVTCAACAWVASRSRLAPAWSMRLIALATGAYAVFSAARVAVALTAGWESPLYRAAFSFGPTTLLGAAAVLMIGGAVVGVRFATPVDLSPSGHSGETLVVVADWELASAAYGPDRLRDLVMDLRRAARDVDETATEVPRGAGLSVPDPLAAIDARLRTAYGWAPEQSILLVEEAAPRSSRRGSSRRHGLRWRSAPAAE